jgi:UDP-N-acetylglucosamine--N-acetylmuramyl-(pentapeptide) pyrophosphoryl-undecaprenol N-acetylglucosamine transferase
VVVGTGGYAAGIMLAYSVVHRVPIVQQAGDSVPGLTARAFSRWSREIYLNFPEAAAVLASRSPDVFVDTGAPIDPPPVPRPDRAAARLAWGLPENTRRVLLISGASQGSLAINTMVGQWIERGIPDGLSIIWSTGRGTYEEFEHYERPNIRVREYLAPITDAYAAADFALSRAGAMTTAEQFAWGIPAVLVPLPSAAADHQTANAVTLERAGAAIHIPQSALTVDRADATIRRLIDDPAELDRLRQGAIARARPAAAAAIASRILALIDS